MSDLALPGTAVLHLSDGSSFDVSFGNEFSRIIPPLTRHFFGVVSGVAITSVTLTPDQLSSASTNELIDNFVFSAATSSTPEPATGGLILTAIALLWGARRWSLKKTAGLPCRPR
jgi:hypothetical protein